MKTTRTPSILDQGKIKAWNLWGAAVVSFLAGSLCTAQLTHLRQVRADSNQVFELMVYHTMPGKVPALESIFRDVSKLQTKHNLNIVGYWVLSENSDWKDTFVYLVAHPSREQAEANWRALHADSAFLPYRKSAEPLIARIKDDYHVDEIYMRPTAFSPMK